MANLLFPPREGGEIAGPCRVCGEELGPTHNAECEYCNEYFHMRMTEDEASRGAKDCGMVWLDDEGMIFACDTCIKEHNLLPA